jgi:hypothetical protein
MSWAIVKKSSLPEAGYGLFSCRNIKCGGTVGVLMGSKVSSSLTPKQNSDHAKLPYAAVGIAPPPDGDMFTTMYEGLSLHLGMYFINDPCFNKPTGTTCSYNVCLKPDGRIVALCPIEEGDEFFICYKRPIER